MSSIPPSAELLMMLPSSSSAIRYKPLWWAWPRDFCSHVNEEGDAVRRETPTVDDSSWSALVGGIFTDIAHLMASELEIAKHEVGKKSGVPRHFLRCWFLGCG